MNNLGIKQRRVGTITILEVNSVLRIALKFGMSAVSLERAVDSLMNSGQQQILLDLEGLRSISAKSIGELVSIYAKVARGGGEFKLFNLTPSVKQLMSATKLAGVFGCYESEQAAIESFASATPVGEVFSATESNRLN